MKIHISLIVVVIQLMVVMVFVDVHLVDNIIQLQQYKNKWD
jgi:hypothetical protein